MRAFIRKLKREKPEHQNQAYNSSAETTSVAMGGHFLRCVETEIFL